MSYPSGMPYRQDDISLLLPSFRKRVEGVLRRVRAAGHDPCLFDTTRTLAEAQKNAKKGTGAKNPLNSMHLYGCAADVICNAHGWDCAKHKCDFYTVLLDATKAEGLVSGRYFEKVDLPHMQGVRVGQQAEMKALGVSPESAAARDALVRRFLELTSLRIDLRAQIAAGTVDAWLVKAFQREQGLTVDGKLGPKTLARLG